MIVTIKDRPGEEFEFPDEMPLWEIKAAMARHLKHRTESTASKGPFGLGSLFDRLRGIQGPVLKPMPPSPEETEKAVKETFGEGFWEDYVKSQTSPILPGLPGGGEQPRPPRVQMLKTDQGWRPVISQEGKEEEPGLEPEPIAEAFLSGGPYGFLGKLATKGASGLLPSIVKGLKGAAAEAPIWGGSAAASEAASSALEDVGAIPRTIGAIAAGLIPPFAAGTLAARTRRLPPPAKAQRPGVPAATTEPAPTVPAEPLPAPEEWVYNPRSGAWISSEPPVISRKPISPPESAMLEPDSWVYVPRSGAWTSSEMSVPSPVKRIEPEGPPLKIGEAKQRPSVEPSPGPPLPPRLGDARLPKALPEETSPRSRGAVETVREVPAEAAEAPATGARATEAPSQGLAEWAKRNLGEREGIILLDSARQPVGFLSMSAEEMARLEPGDVASRAAQILREAEKLDARGIAVNITGKAPSSIEQALNNVTDVARQARVPLVDAIVEGTSKIKSGWYPASVKLHGGFAMFDPAVASEALSSLKSIYTKYIGEPLWSQIQRNPGTTAGTIVGGIEGLNVAGEDAPTVERLALAMAGAAAGFAGAKGIGKIAGGRLAEALRRGLIDNYGLSPEYVALKRHAKIFRNDIASQFLTVAQEVRKLPLAQRKLLANMLQGEGEAADLRELNETARKAIVRTGQLMVDLGLLSEKTFLKNAATYLHRTYLSRISGRPSADPFRKTRLILSELKPRGIVQEVPADQVASWEKRGWEYFGKSANKTPTGQPMAFVRRQLTKEERQLAGEIEDAGYAIATTGQLLANDIATYRLYSDIAQRFASEEARPGYVLVSKGKVPQTNINRWGDLEGKWIPEEIYRDLEMTDLARSLKNLPGVREYLALTKWWKASKTAFNPVVHTNNVISNLALYDAAEGNWRMIPKALKDMVAAKRGKLSQEFREAQADGVFGSDFVTNELAKIKRETLDAYLKAENDLLYGNNLLRAAVRIARRLARVAQALPDLYRAEDNFLRYALYLTQRQAGATRQQAADYARTWLLDYDISAPVVAFLRATALPFVGFTYRAAPRLVETAVRRPWKFAKWAAMGWALNELGYLNVSPEQRAQEQKLLPEPYRGPLFGIPGMPPKALRLPFTVGGLPQFLEATRWVPGGDILDVTDIRTSQMPFLPEPLQPSFGPVGSIMAALQGFDPYLGTKMRGLGISPTEDILTRAKYTIPAFVPNFPGIPGAYSTYRILNALRGTPGLLGEVLTPLQAIGQSVGVKVRPLDVNKARIRAALETQDEIRAISQKMHDLTSDYLAGRISKESYERQIAGWRKEIMERSNKLQRRMTP